MRMMWGGGALRWAAVMAVCAGAAGSSRGIVINLTHVYGGQQFSSWTQDAADTGSRNGQTLPPAPGGDYSAMNARLDSVVECAAGWWESAIHDAHTLNIRYGWSLGGAAGGIDVDANADTRANPLTRDVTTAPGHSRAVDVVIRFNSNANINWWLDDNLPVTKQQFMNPQSGQGPWRYTNGVESSSNIRLGFTEGPVMANSGRTSLGLDEAAIRTDLFTSALHEIGHALGMTTDTFPIGEAGILLTGARESAFGGETNLGLATVVGANGTHLIYPSSLMAAGHPVGTRAMISAVDVLAAAEQSDWEDFDLDPSGKAQVPAPGAAVVLAGAGLLAVRRRC